MKWNSQLYDRKHDFVSKYGEELVELLAPKEGERILDLGCGTGDLSDLISRNGATVTGLDNSPEMIEAARKKYPTIQFDIASADDFHVTEKFDAVFSNATLHWVLNFEAAVKCIYASLKPGGRFVAELGGKGNVSRIVTALTSTLQEYGAPDAANKEVWYFPSLSEYACVLEQNGFRVVWAAHFDRPTELKDEDGIRNWLRMFGWNYLQDLDEQTLQKILTAVEEQIRPSNFHDARWYADYVRLRIVATRQ